MHSPSLYARYDVQLYILPPFMLDMIYSCLILMTSFFLRVIFLEPFVEVISIIWQSDNPLPFIKDFRISLLFWLVNVFISSSILLLLFHYIVSLIDSMRSLSVSIISMCIGKIKQLCLLRTFLVWFLNLIDFYFSVHTHIAFSKDCCIGFQLIIGFAGINA